MTSKLMDRTTTGALKGIALILMFVHHLFCFPEFLIGSVSYSRIQDFADLFCMPTEICVPVFAFLTGYFYCFTKNKTLEYSFRKITDLYISYWVVYLFLLGLALGLGCYEFSLYVFAFEMTAAKTELMVFCWYVIFYGLTMVLLPLLTGKRGHAPWRDLLAVLVLPVVLASVLLKRELGGIWYNLCLYTVEWFPCVAVGYLFGKYGLFEKFLDGPVREIRSGGVRCLTWAAAVLAAMAGRYWCNYLYLGQLDIRGGAYTLIFKTDILYAPLFVWGCVNLLQYLKKSCILRGLAVLGRYSLLMWFLHCAFYNPCRDLLQPILYGAKNPLLVLVWGLLLSLLPALALDPVVRYLQKLKNRILAADSR